MNEIKDTTYHNLDLHVNKKPPLAHTLVWWDWLDIRNELGQHVCPTCSVVIQFEEA